MIGSGLVTAVITMLTRATVFGYYDHDFLTIAEHGNFGGARQRDRPR